VAKKLERFTANTLSTRAALEQELTSVRERGVASVRDEWEIGVSGVSSAIFDSRKYPIAALGISGPSERLSPSALKKFGVSVKKCAAQISERLGYI
jgi:DNA-binding IclR family transcriptional regulator